MISPFYFPTTAETFNFVSNGLFGVTVCADVMSRRA